MSVKRMIMKKLSKDQSGFSLLELIIVVALTGLITAAITTTVFQVFNMNTRTANRMAAVSQVQQAGKLVSEDVLEALSVDTESELLKTTRTGAGTNATHVIIYALEGGELWRSESIDGGDPIVTRVAEYIDSDPIKTRCDWDGTVLIFRVTAKVGDESETREYKIKPRPGS